MANISKNKRPSRRDIAYFRQRQKNRVFTDLVKVFAEESERTGMTKKDWAELLEKTHPKLRGGYRHQVILNWTHSAIFS
jgi:hypothetical protein